MVHSGAASLRSPPWLWSWCSTCSFFEGICFLTAHPCAASSVCFLSSPQQISQNRFLRPRDDSPVCLWYPLTALQLLPHLPSLCFWCFALVIAQAASPEHHTPGYYNNRDLFLVVSESGKPRWRCLQSQCPGFWTAAFLPCLLEQASEVTSHYITLWNTIPDNSTLMTWLSPKAVPPIPPPRTVTLGLGLGEHVQFTHPPQVASSSSAPFRLLHGSLPLPSSHSSWYNFSIKCPLALCASRFCFLSVITWFKLKLYTTDPKSVN